MTDATFAANLPRPRCFVAGRYVSGTQRPVVAHGSAGWQPAAPCRAGAATAAQTASSQPRVSPASWGVAQATPSVQAFPLPRTLRPAPQATAGVFQRAARATGAPVVVLHADALHSPRMSAATGYAVAPRRHGDAVATQWQDMLHDRRKATASTWQPAARASREWHGSFGPGRPAPVGWVPRWQVGIRPPAGISVLPPGPAADDPCYVPPAGGAVHLLFKDAPGGPNLVFVCDRHGGGQEPPTATVVPIKRVYVVLNNVTLRRVDNNAVLPTLSLSVSIDADSWVWSFAATLPGAALADLQPSSAGDPVVLEASINGTKYRLLAESPTREREFGTSVVRIQGRGIAALLDAPYAPVQVFGNTQQRSAQQLMTDVLTLNGVSIGWSVAWGLTDWPVPAGAWSHQGTYISAINQIAAAAGGYVQAHPTQQTLRVLPRYPVAPWAWAGATPDIELPAAVVLRESIEWTDKAAYNRVYVSGTGTGVLGQVTRAGTAGDLLAPMVTDNLITHADAARQRGLAVLADGGRQAAVTLRLPVLAETGVIAPGTLVRYVDGSVTRVGLVRSVDVQADGGPEVWQSIGVETHA